MLNKIPKTFVVVIVLLAFTTNIAFAGEWVLKKKDPEKAKELSISIKGFFCHGLAHFYAGDITTGVVYLGSQIGASVLIYMFNATSLANGSPEWSAYPKVITAIALAWYFVNWNGAYKDSQEYIKIWNEAVDKNDFSEVRNRKLLNAIGSLLAAGIFCAVMVVAPPPSDTKIIVQDLIVIGGSTIPLAVGWLVERSRLPKKGTKQDVKLLPYFTPQRSGIMLVKRF